MINPLIHAAEKNFVYIATKIENVAKQTLILLAKTVSKLVYRVRFFLAKDRAEQRELVERVSIALDQDYPFNLYFPYANLKRIGLSKINDFYDLEGIRANISYACRGTWEILTM